MNFIIIYNTTLNRLPNSSEVESVFCKFLLKKVNLQMLFSSSVFVIIDLIYTISDISLKKLVNPSKTPEKVLQESEVGHDMYKRTHCDYHPSEKIDRR